ncbi:MAG TPA: PmoA family protein [Prosthecobacter sp.]
MKFSACLLPFLCGQLATASAAPVRFTVQGGDVEQRHAIVTFQAPPGWQDVHAVTDGKSSEPLPLQVDADGQAVLVIPHVAAREEISFSPVPSPGNQNTPAAGFSVKKDNGLLQVSRQAAGKEQRIFGYQMEPGEVPPGVSKVFAHGAHLHPVYTPGGRLLTGNHPADHRWHRGIWMAWTKTEFDGAHPDFWNQGKSDIKGQDSGPLLGEVKFAKLVKMWAGPVQAGFVSQHQFVDHSTGNARTVLDETWEVRIHALPVGGQPAFVMDLVSTQTCASSVPLKLPRYHYGGLGVRGHAQWDPADKVSMLTSNGDDRKKGDSTKARWVSMGGEVDSQPASMGILIHPDNFRFPQPLRLNPKNPQLCIAPSQDGDWAIEPGKPLVSRYRFVLTDGPADAALLESAWKAYASPLKVTFN